MRTHAVCLLFAGVLVTQSARGEALPRAEYGHALAPDEALDGWISLYDGKTSFGWTGAVIDQRQLVAGTTTSRFGNIEVRLEVARAGTLVIGEQKFDVPSGPFSVVREGPAASIQLVRPIALRAILVRPLGLEAIFDGQDLSGWKRVDRAELPESKWPKWEIQNGVLHAMGGPGALEYEGTFANLVLQLKARSRARYANGGVFFRSQPGLFMMGYEAQIHNRCEDNDPGRPSRYSTGAIDDRQMARRLVSRDGEPFMMTVVADGPHLATWVNGYQMTDWTDDRPKHENPREGLRTEAGTVQLQAHDPMTDIEFLSVGIAELKTE